MVQTHQHITLRKGENDENQRHLAQLVQVPYQGRGGPLGHPLPLGDVRQHQPHVLYVRDRWLRLHLYGRHWSDAQLDRHHAGQQHPRATRSGWEGFNDPDLRGADPGVLPVSQGLVWLRGNGGSRTKFAPSLHLRF